MLIAIDAELLEGFLALAKGVEVRSIHGNAGAETRQFFEDVNEAVGTLKRQRPEEHAVHHGKDCCVGADSEGQRSHGDQGYAPGFDQHSDRVSQVLP